MQCEEVREQFADYVIRGAEEPASLQIAQHLMTCESCRTEAEDLKILWTALGAIPPGAEPGPGARASFNLMLEAYKHGLERPAARSWWQGMNTWLGGWWPRQPTYQVILALALLAVGVMVGFLAHSSRSLYNIQPDPEIVELRDELLATRDELLATRQMVALSLMQQQSASERLKGVNWSYQLRQPGGEVLTALLSTLMHDPNVNVRLATVEALRQFGDQTVVRQGILEAFTHQESPMVQVALIDLVVDLHEKESIATLRQLTQDSKIDVSVRDRAQKGLAEME
jgi:HEAT repeats